MQLVGQMALNGNFELELPLIGQRAQWIEESVQWATEAGWLYVQERESAAERAAVKLQQLRSKAVQREGSPKGTPVGDWTGRSSPPGFRTGRGRFRRRPAG